MKRNYFKPFSSLFMAFVVLLICGSGVALADRFAHYKVTIDNLTDQPFSSPIAVTHQDSLTLFEVEALALKESEVSVDTGQVTQVIDMETPVASKEASTFMIMARTGDRLSLAYRVDCSNEGLAGLNRAWLPKRGAEIIWVTSQKSGIENNTNPRTGISAPCNADSSEFLSGDSNANDQDQTDSVVKITITRVDGEANRFLASLSGAGEVPPAALTSDAWGQADFKLNGNMSELSYRLKALKMESGAIQAAIHQGLPDDNGPVVAFLYRRTGSLVDERLNISGRVRQGDLVGPLAGDFEGFVDALHAGELYVNIHSNAYPAGEIRGQVGAN